MNNWTDFNSNTIQQDDFVLTNGNWFCVDCINMEDEILHCLDKNGGEKTVCFDDVECVDDILNRLERELI
tara:strand:- start:136 stop:345 length:210 start_codon:yes stop_codon:yes gene_type:complete